MSITGKLTAPLRFVENEFEALVGTIYTAYKKRYGRDNYSLSEFYIQGGSVFLSGSIFFQSGMSFQFYTTAVCMGIYSYVIEPWRNNHQRQLEKELTDAREPIKNRKLEKYKAISKGIGRLFLAFSVDRLADYFFDYSILGLLVENPTLNLPELALTFSSILFAFGHYTSAIDTNNPKKSKVMQGLRNFFSYSPERALAKLPVRKPDSTPHSSRQYLEDVVSA